MSTAASSTSAGLPIRSLATTGALRYTETKTPPQHNAATHRRVETHCSPAQRSALQRQLNRMKGQSTKGQRFHNVQVYRQCHTSHSPRAATLRAYVPCATDRNASVTDSQFAYLGGSAMTGWGYTTSTDPEVPPGVGIDGTNGCEGMMASSLSMRFHRHEQAVFIQTHSGQTDRR